MGSWTGFYDRLNTRCQLNQVNIRPVRDLVVMYGFGLSGERRRGDEPDAVSVCFPKATALKHGGDPSQGR